MLTAWRCDGGSRCGRWLLCVLLLSAGCREIFPYTRDGRTDGLPGAGPDGRADGLPGASFRFANGFSFGQHPDTVSASSAPLQILTSDSLCGGGPFGSGRILLFSSNGASRKACVISLTSLRLPKEASISASGDHPLVILVQGDAIIDGKIDVGAHTITPGPGGWRGGRPPGEGGTTSGQGDGAGAGQTCPQLGNSDLCGGGGAGHATAGAQGGAAGIAGASVAGPSHGTSALALEGGSGGGRSGEMQAAEGMRGGAGGGALQMSVIGVLTVNGAITAGGGGGAGGLSTNGGGGGGSGGSILLEALAIDGSGWVSANGGGGGGSGSYNKGVNGSDGSDGGPTLSPALGGAGITKGGNGGSSSSGPTDGESSTTLRLGGGGGGAAGRVHLSWPGGAAQDPQRPIQCSGSVTLGAPAL